MKKFLSIALLVETCFFGASTFAASQAPSTAMLSSTRSSLSSWSASVSVATDIPASTESAASDVKESSEEKSLAAANSKKHKFDKEAEDEDEAKRAGKRNRDDAEVSSDDEEDKGEQEIAFLTKQIEQAIATFRPSGKAIVERADSLLSYQRSGFSLKSQAVAMYREAAALRKIEAMEKLRQCYEQGKGVVRDEKMAADWAKKAEVAVSLEKVVYEARNYQDEADPEPLEKPAQLFTDAMQRGSINAKAGLGYCYLSGSGVARDRRRGLVLLHEALEQGSIDALYWTACGYDGGFLVGREQGEVIKLFHKAVEAGSAEAMGALGRMHRDGSGGVAEDLDKAIEFFTRAAEKGNFRAINDLAFCYLDGLGVAKDDKKAVGFFNQAVAAGSISALGYLGFCYETGRGVEANALAAGDCFARGYEGGSGYATDALGRCYLMGFCGFAANAARAVELFTQSVARGFAWAHAALFYCYQHGLGVAQDEKMANKERALAVKCIGEDATVETIDALDNFYNSARPCDEKLTTYDCSTDICSICQSKIWSGQRASYLACKHRFHSSCILRWLKGSLGSLDDDDLGHTTCPFCRHNILTECVAE